MSYNVHPDNPVHTPINQSINVQQDYNDTVQERAASGALYKKDKVTNEYYGEIK